LVRRTGTLLAGIVAIAALAGCDGGGSGDLSKKDDKDLRSNFSRPLTPEEAAQMGGGASKATEGAGRPERQRG